MIVIKIAFAFDHNFYRQAGVAISSLLDFADSAVTYEIYCLCSYDVKESDKRELANVVKERSRSIKIHFKMMDCVFDESYEVRGITKATYFRLLLHRLLPDVDKIIYSDVDVLFKGNLLEVWEQELGDNLLGVVKGPIVNRTENFKEYVERFDYFKRYLWTARGTYFNAGFLLMNLEGIRRENLEERWIQMTRKNYNFQDQDILNITCSGRVTFLPPKFNVLIHVIESTNYYKDLVDEKVFCAQEVEDIYNHPVVIHFAIQKPWDFRGLERFDEWWEYTRNRTPFFDYFFMRSECIEMQKELSLLFKCAKMDVSRNLLISACFTRALIVLKRGFKIFRGLCRQCVRGVVSFGR